MAAYAAPVTAALSSKEKFSLMLLRRWLLSRFPWANPIRYRVNLFPIFTIHWVPTHYCKVISSYGTPLAMSSERYDISIVVFLPSAFFDEGGLLVNQSLLARSSLIGIIYAKQAAWTTFLNICDFIQLIIEWNQSIRFGSLIHTSSKVINSCCYHA